MEEHVRDIAPQGPCRVLSSVELEDFNGKPNRLGISLECKEAVDDLRKRIEKETKGDKMPAFYNSDTMTLLKQRVDSNVLLYINGSNTSEKTARSQLWRWYLIFKKLRPDDELPRNPFIPAQRPAEPGGIFRADALRTFMHAFDQRRMEGCLPQLDDDQRTALGHVFLDTLDMLDSNETSKRQRSVQKRNPRKRQKRSPPEDHGSAPDSTDATLAPTIPAPAPWQLELQQHTQQLQQQRADMIHSFLTMADFECANLSTHEGEGKEDTSALGEPSAGVSYFPSTPWTDYQGLS